MAPSLLGPQHGAEAARMTARAAVATAAAAALLAVLGGGAALLAAPLWLPLYVAAELLFVIVYVHRAMILGHQPLKHRPLEHDPQGAAARVMQHLATSGADAASFLSVWFHGAPLSSIRAGNVADLFAYAFYYKTPDEVAAEGQAPQLWAMVQQLQDTWGLKLQPGRNPELRYMCHLWEPMRHWYRPLAFYLTIEVLAALHHVALTAAGFRYASWQGISYYTINLPHRAAAASAGSYDAAAAALDAAAGRSGADAAAAAAACSAGASSSSSRTSSDGCDSSGVAGPPLVLLHGIGMGLIPYTGLLMNLAATSRPVLALSLKHISMRWVLWVPTVDEVAEVLVGVLRREGLGKAVLLAHSYGTAVASRLLQRPHNYNTAGGGAPVLRGLALVDPVVFGMFMPNLLRSFIYQTPASGSLVGDFMMMAAARDLHVSATLSRRFFWSDVNLFEEQLPPNTLVELSGRDVLMAASEVKAWLEQRSNAVVMYHPHHVHAGFVLDNAWQQQILQQLLVMVDAAEQHQQLEQQQQQQLVVEEEEEEEEAAGGKAGALHAAAPAGDEGSAGWSGAGVGAAARLERSSSLASWDGGAMGHGRASSSSSSVDSSSDGGGGAMSGSCSSTLADGCEAAALQRSPAPVTPHEQQQLQLEPLRSWSGMLLPGSGGGGLCSSHSTGAASQGPESPRTYVSATSAHSWQDAPGAAASRDASRAARALLRPLLALQQQPRGHMAARAAVASAHGTLVQPAAWPAAGRPQQQLLPPQRDGVLRRVEVLLHRGQQLRRPSSAPGHGALL